MLHSIHTKTAYATYETHKNESAEVLKIIRLALRRDATDDPEKISVELLGKKAILRGNVRSVAEKEAAGRAALSGSGITEVENNLLIEIPAFLF